MVYSHMLIRRVLFHSRHGDICVSRIRHRASAYGNSFNGLFRKMGEQGDERACKLADSLGLRADFSHICNNIRADVHADLFIVHRRSSFRGADNPVVRLQVVCIAEKINNGKKRNTYPYF